MRLRPSPVEFEVPYEGRYGGPVHHQRQHDHSSGEENDPVFVHLFDGVHTCGAARQNDARDRVTPCHVVPFSERTALDGVGGAYLGNIAEKEEGGRDVGTDGERENASSHVHTGVL